MNPTVPQSIIDDAMEEDPAKAQAEYLAEFRSDIESFISREVIENAIELGRHELPYAKGTSYFAFCDPSGGSSDSMTIAIAHREEEHGERDNATVILDAIRERRPPFSPENVVAEFCDLLKLYKITRARGDRYGGEWPREQFRKQSIQYDFADNTKNQIYLEALPLLNSGKAELLDNQRLIAQLVGLERRTSRGGKDSIDHAPGAHDDIANAVLGALVLAAANNNRPWQIPSGLTERLARPATLRHRSELISRMSQRQSST